MDDSHSFRILRLNKKGAAAPIHSSEYQDLSASDDSILWIKCVLCDSTADSLRKLNVISSEYINILCAKDTRPRSFIANDCLIGNYRGVRQKENSGKKTKAEWVSSRVFISKNVIVTVRTCAQLSVHNIEEKLLANMGPTSSAEFFVSLLTGLNEEISDVVCSFDADIDCLASTLSDNSDYRAVLSRLRRRVIVLRRYLVPQRDAILTLQTEKLSWFSQGDCMHIREISDSILRIVEDLDAERDRMAILHEELFAKSQENLNKKMYVLAMVAVIFLPITFITGLLGINVDGIPGSQYIHGFWVVCLILLFVFICQLVYLRRKKLL